jgi:hypothetical protein
MNDNRQSDDCQHRLFVKRTELGRARGYVVKELPEERDVLPWQSSNPSIRACWDKIAQPSNIDSLREWLAGTSDQEKRRWTEQAIKQAEEVLKQS